MSRRKTALSKAGVAIVLTKVGDDYYIQLNDDEKVAGFESVEKAVADMTATYSRHHRLGQVASASACINYIFFQRAVIAVKDVADLRNKLLPAKKALEVCSVTHVSGHMLGLKADPKKAGPIWDAAPKPNLIEF